MSKESQLKDNLVEKSIEAFIMGLEIYNKPTIKYRIEGFSFFICNAWELMLKAELINRGKSIYFKDNPERTISIEKAVENIFTNSNGALRKNLEQIIKLRNTSTHFITEDYEYIYAPLFQACVINFVSKMEEFHSVDITQYIAQNFLTLSVRLEHLTEDEIRAKYTGEMAEHFLKEKSKIEKSTVINNTDFAIPVETNFISLKIKKEADLSLNIDKNSEITTRVLREVKNPNDLYPLTTKDVIKSVNKRLKAQKILLSKERNGEIVQTVFTSYDLQLFNSFYDIKNNEKFCFHYKIGNRFGYSQRLCDFLIEEISKDPQNFVQHLKKGIKK